MIVRLVVVGAMKELWLRAAIEEYTKRLKKYASVKVEMLASKRKSFSSIKEQNRYEAALILPVFSETDFVILLDDKGQQFTSEAFAKQLEKYAVNGTKIVFVIGGAYGFDEAVYARANAKMSLSAMTFSHQMVRLIFVEQLYRAMTILKGEPYHHS